MNKNEMAAALREAARRIEASDYAGENLSVEIAAHRIDDKEALTSLMQIPDRKSIEQMHYDDYFWMDSRIERNVKFTVFFDPQIIGKVTKETKVVTTQVDGSLLDLLSADQAESELQTV